MQKVLIKEQFAEKLYNRDSSSLKREVSIYHMIIGSMSTVPYKN